MVRQFATGVEGVKWPLREFLFYRSKRRVQIRTTTPFFC
jgi:hypothetical protein